MINLERIKPDIDQLKRSGAWPLIASALIMMGIALVLGVLLAFGVIEEVPRS